MPKRGAGRLALGLAMLVQGCAGMAPERSEPRAVATARHPAGAFSVQAGRPGLVIGAPHGTSDSETDQIGLDLARRTGWSLVVATGFSHLDPEGRRFNVNRPTESVPGSPARLERATEAAREVYDLYRAHVLNAAQGPLRLYVEVHGNGRRESAGRIEIATVGIAAEEAWRLKTLLEIVRDAHVRGQDAVPRLMVLVEPLDPLHYTASAAKQGGVLALSERAIHIELPRAARTAWQSAYTAVLADFLTQAAALLLPPAR